MKYSTIILLLIVFLFHLPFLEADPDHELSFSRDAFTDEGLYTAQARNCINGASFNLHESDAAIKTPLFSFFAFTVFKIFSPSLIVIRVAVLVFSLTFLFFAFKDDFPLLLLFTLTTILLYTNFFYQHLALAEFMAGSCLIVVFYLLTRSSNTAFAIRTIFFIGILISFSWLLKIQYIYMIGWPVLFFVLYGLYLFTSGRAKFKRVGQMLLQYLAVSILFVFVYALIWYFPNKALFDFVILNQTETLFGEGEWFQKMIDFNIENFFMNTRTGVFTIMFCCCALVAPYIVYKLRGNSFYMCQFLAAFTWCLIEIYKPAMVYLPSRYLVVTFLAMGLFSSVIIKGIFLLNQNNRMKYILPALLLCAPVFVNARSLVNSYENRKYTLRQANEFVALKAKAGCYIVGPWAASVSWKAKLIAIPVWKDYFNDHQIMELYHPCIIVSELSEEDSGNAFSDDNINLESITAEKYQFTVRGWEPCIYILK